MLFSIYSPNPWLLFSGVGGQLQNVTFNSSSARCIRWSIIALIRISCRCVIDVMLLGCACCTMLIQSRTTVCSVSSLLLQPEFDASELQPQPIHWSLKYQGVERPNLQGVSCRPGYDCGMTFCTLCLTPELWMGLSVQSTVGCFLSCVFFNFRGAGACGVAKAIHKQFYFSHLCLCCWFE